MPPTVQAQSRPRSLPMPQLRLGTVLVGLALLLPGGCSFGPAGGQPAARAKARTTKKNKADVRPTVGVPRSRPPGWDPIPFNKARGNSGAIPRAYRDEINGPTGETQHLGRHLPYQPIISTETIPPGYVALMWGDPDKGHARHPQARSSAKHPKGHWFDWIRIRRSDDGEAPEEETVFPEWPGTAAEGQAGFVVYGGGKIESDSGRNTIYLAKLPSGAKIGDNLRVWAHCRRHGEYVDFVTLR